jgi:hypothetical protein
MRGSATLFVSALLAVSLGCESTPTPPPTTTTECRGPGHYQSGKEGSYRPCCAGLTEVFHLYPAHTSPDNAPICTEVPLRVYACVRGTCGDGVCEEGEDVRCGCVADCPSAVWGPQDAAATN